MFSCLQYGCAALKIASIFRLPRPSPHSLAPSLIAKATTGRGAWISNHVGRTYVRGQPPPDRRCRARVRLGWVAWRAGGRTDGRAAGGRELVDGCVEIGHFRMDSRACACVLCLLDSLISRNLIHSPLSPEEPEETLSMRLRLVVYLSLALNLELAAGDSVLVHYCCYMCRESPRRIITVY